MGKCEAKEPGQGADTAWPAEDIPTEGAPAEDVAAEVTPVEDAAAETVTAEDAAAEDTPAGDAAAKDTTAAPRPKKSRWFLIALALYAVVLLAVSGYLQISLWRYLESSQAEMDRQAAEQAERQAYEKALYQAPQLAFESWQSGLTADYWTELWYAKAPNDLDTRESVLAFMAERFASDATTAYKAAGFTAGTPVYVLKNGEDSLARVTLTGSELNWSVSEVELLIEGAHSATVTVPDRCHVSCNGRELGEDYMDAAESRFRYEPLKGRLDGAVTWVSYHVEGLLLEPELTVEPPEDFSLIQAEEGDYLLGLGGDTDTYTDTAVKFVKAYLYYYMSGRSNTWGNMSKALSYLTPGTQAYRDISDTYNGVYWAPAYTGIDTSKTYAGDVIAWADNCFSVDVTYNADCVRADQHIDYADATMRIYFRQTNRGYIIDSFEVLF